MSIITSLNYDGCLSISTFHFSRIHLAWEPSCCRSPIVYILVATLPRIISVVSTCFVLAFFCHFIPSPVPYTLHSIICIQNEKRKSRHARWMKMFAFAFACVGCCYCCCVLSLQASFQLFLFIGCASNLLDMFIRTTCHKKISGVNFFLVRFDVNAWNCWK